MDNVRSALARLLVDLRAHTQDIAVLEYPQCTTDPSYRHAIGLDLLLRRTIEREVIVSNNILEIFTQAVELSRETKIDIGEFQIETEEYPEPYEDYTRTVYKIVYNDKETDQEYLHRINDIYNRLIDFPTSKDDLVDLYSRIIAALHTARHITLDDSKIRECLDDMERLYNSKNNDHNGEIGLLEMRRRYREVVKELCLKWI